MTDDLVHRTDTNAPPPPRPLSAEEIKDYLDYNGQPLRERREELIRALQANLRQHPAINDDAVLGMVAENIRMALALTRTTEERRTADKSPFLSGGRVVDGWYRDLIAPLLLAMAPLQQIMNEYGERKLERSRAQAQADRLRLAAEAEKAAHRAADALEQGKRADEALNHAAEASAAADAAAAFATARPAELTRTHGVFGAVASVRQKWRWRVIDISLVPRTFLTVDAEAVDAAGKSRTPDGKPYVQIPGIEWYSETKMGVR